MEGKVPYPELYAQFMGDMFTGLEVSVLEIVLALHDQGVIPKDTIADRLEALARRMPGLYEYEPERAPRVAFPIERLARSIRNAEPIDSDGRPLP